MLSPTFVAQNSTYIENLMRHRFVYDVSRLVLQRDPPGLVTVLTSEVDNAGVDVVMTFGQITRQIQMKTLAKTITSNPYAISESLSGLVGGCVVWVCYDRASLEPTCYHMMGGRGDARMRDLMSFPEGTRKKRGIKVSRRGYRNIRIRDAEHRNLSLKELVSIFFDLPV